MARLGKHARRVRMAPRGNSPNDQGVSVATLRKIRFPVIEVKVTAATGLDGFGRLQRMVEWQRLVTIRTDDSPCRDKRANDSAAQRLTHMRWDGAHAAGNRGGRSSRRTVSPHCCPHCLPDPDRIRPLTWSPVTESNRRPSPCHVPPNGSLAPGTAAD